MDNTVNVRCVVVALAALLVVATSFAWAQVDSGLAGVASDTTGAVLPGVTVEAASPALIEGVRVAVTDGAGRYNITALRPGTYTVTFTLPGFSTFVREGIELSAGFTANVDGEMSVGAIEETITVSGESPLVDIQNARAQEVIRTGDVRRAAHRRRVFRTAGADRGRPRQPGQPDHGQGCRRRQG